MILCQYVKADVIERALNAEGFWVKASCPSDFNDPFECTGGVYGDPASPVVEEFYATRPDQAHHASLHGDRTEYLQKWLRRAFSNRNFLGQGYKISCFSSVEGIQQFSGSDIRMWAHYTNNGMGVRIEFDSDDIPYFTDAVNYSYEAPKLDLSGINHIEDLEEYIKSCIVTKHKIWEPEQEVRIVFRGPHAAVRFDSEVNMYRWLLPLSCIKKIAIGEALLKVHMSSSCLRHVRNIIHDAAQHISTVAVVRDYNSYGLDYHDITL